MILLGSCDVRYLMTQGFHSVKNIEYLWIRTWLLLLLTLNRFRPYIFSQCNSYLLGQLLLVEIDGLTFCRSFRDEQPVTDLTKSGSDAKVITRHREIFTDLLFRWKRAIFFEISFILKFLSNSKQSVIQPKNLLPFQMARIKRAMTGQLRELLMEIPRHHPLYIVLRFLIKSNLVRTMARLWQ